METETQVLSRSHPVIASLIHFRLLSQKEELAAKHESRYTSKESFWLLDVLDTPFFAVVDRVSMSNGPPP